MFKNLICVTHAAKFINYPLKVSFAVLDSIFKCISYLGASKSDVTISLSRYINSICVLYLLSRKVKCSYI